MLKQSINTRCSKENFPQTNISQSSWKIILAKLASFRAWAIK